MLLISKVPTLGIAGFKGWGLEAEGFWVCGFRVQILGFWIEGLGKKLTRNPPTRKTRHFEKH